MAKLLTFGQVREIPGNANETRIIPFILSTATRDRYNTVLNQDNWRLDNYKANPIVGYMHNLYGDLCNPPEPDDVIGKSMDIGAVDQSGQRVLVAAAYFEEAALNIKADKVFRKLLLGTLNAASVGFGEVGAGDYGPNLEAKGMENETYYFAGQELYEWSVVNIGGNPQALKKSMRDQSSAALYYVVRSLSPKLRLSQIENLRVRDVLDLLDGKDLEIKETDPDKVREMLRDEVAKEEMARLIESQQKNFKR
jgi:hypothetical protein